MRISTRLLVAVMFVAAVASSATPALAPAQQLDTTVSLVLSRIQDPNTQTMGISRIERVLRSQGNVQERQAAEKLADSLVAMVLDTVGHILSPDVRFRIISNLGYTGSVIDRGDAVFDGAKYRLARIAFEAPTARDRATAVYQLTTIADSQFALDILKRIALSDDDDTSYWAVVRLWDGMENKGGIAVLKELWDSDSVKSPLARRSLSAQARKYGWK